MPSLRELSLISTDVPETACKRISDMVQFGKLRRLEIQARRLHCSLAVDVASVLGQSCNVFGSLSAVAAELEELGTGVYRCEEPQLSSLLAIRSLSGSTAWKWSEFLPGFLGVLCCMWFPGLVCLGAHSLVQTLHSACRSERLTVTPSDWHDCVRHSNRKLLS